ncbi:hypothetical protein JAAARDRAFT_146366 [Jaapia argillacea MUCL 33604]|uniref:Uncharacterized protein n=1 Tax=Jaapia argillacea MUCL 33604 TaxID=933084 RepID=A0A067QFT8_9AGAM|nr:hypothetical protein JAAARDRAFT_146366 [Jaapia argillacea MUCL 33604]
MVARSHSTRQARIHRLPQRLDYTLIPAPLDISLPLAEKSHLPAIIVTPSSPSSSCDFSIAFLAPPPKPTLRERLSTYAPKFQQFQFRARWVVILVLLFFIMACHVIAHRLAVMRPHLQFDASMDGVGGANTNIDGVGWFDWQWLMGGSNPLGGKRAFVISEPTERGW